MSAPLAMGQYADALRNPHILLAVQQLLHGQPVSAVLSADERALASEIRLAIRLEAVIAVETARLK